MKKRTAKTPRRNKERGLYSWRTYQLCDVSKDLQRHTTCLELYVLQQYKWQCHDCPQDNFCTERKNIFECLPVHRRHPKSVLCVGKLLPSKVSHNLEKIDCSKSRHKVKEATQERVDVNQDPLDQRVRHQVAWIKIKRLLEGLFAVREVQHFYKSARSLLSAAMEFSIFSTWKDILGNEKVGILFIVLLFMKGNTHFTESMQQQCNPCSLFENLRSINCPNNPHWIP